MRALIVFLLAVLAASALGCQESGFDERKETARPLKVQHVLGESKVPGQSERPLTLTADALDDTLALGLQPLRAALPGARLPAYLREAAAGVEVIPPVSAADLPTLEAADPDLIVGSEPDQGELYEDLSTIAPTVMTAGGGGQWKLNVRLVGEALGRTNDAEQLLIDYDTRAAQVRRLVDGGGVPPRVAVARTTADGLSFVGPDSFAATILADVGARRAGAIANADLILIAETNSATHVDGSFERVDAATWFGPGGALAARAALADLASALQR
ncbi:MAG: iron-siderophore transport system substrate-binding protein [Thermoleophilaceae bacterium]|nr:iron-siderophore transport system substrate-binding protein [Thermoleophilaceae bacterium]